MNVVIVGGSGHGSVIADAIQKAGQLCLVGFLDATLPLGKRICGCDVIGRVDDLPAIAAQRNVTGVVVGIGDNWMRAAAVAALRKLVPEISFPNVIHPSVQLAGHVQIGEGNVLLAGSVVSCGAAIGSFCILNTNCSLDHDSRLDDYASLGPRACTGGNVEIGQYTAIGMGAAVIHQIRIGCHSVVGAGATVLHDLPCQVVAYGTPARVIRSRLPEERYLSKTDKRKAFA